MAKAAYIGVKKKSYSLEVAGGNTGGQVTLTLDATIVECWSSSPVVNGQLTSPDATGALSAVYRSYSYFRYPDETTFYSYASQSSGGGSSGAGGGGGGGGSSSSTTSITCQAYELVSSTTSESVAHKVKKIYVGVPDYSYTLEELGGNNGGQVTLTLDSTTVECWSSSPVVSGQLTSPDATGTLSNMYNLYTYFRYPGETTFYSYSSSASSGGGSGGGGGGGGGSGGSSKTSITCKTYSLIVTSSGSPVARKVKKGYIGVNGIAHLFYNDFPDEAPAEWSFMVAYSSDTTFTANEDMWIRVHVFGKCGNGGGSSNYSTQRAGAGGNSGGYACSELIIEKGQSIPCTFTNGVAKFGEYLYATAGASGAHYGTPSTTVGQGYGGNKYNLSGFVGGAGGQGERDAGAAGANSGAKGGSGGSSPGAHAGGAGGGGGARLPVPYMGFPYVANSLTAYSGGRGYYGYRDSDDNYISGGPDNGSSYPALNLSAPMLYGGGNGGGGGFAFYWIDDDENSTHYTDYGPQGNGSAGSPACIIIEKGVF